MGDKIDTRLYSGYTYIDIGFGSSIFEKGKVHGWSFANGYYSMFKYKMTKHSESHRA